MCYAQHSYLDSLKNVVSSEFDPKKRLEVLLELSGAYVENDENTSLYYAAEALKIADALEEGVLLGDTYFTISSIHFSIGNNTKALNYAEKAVEYFQNEKDYRRLAELYIHMEYITDQLGDYPNSLIMAQKALEYFELLKDTAGIAQCYNDIGIVHYYGGEYKAAIDYANMSFRLYKLIGDSAGIGNCYNNMANTYWELGDEELSLKFYQKAYDLDVLIGDLSGQATTLCNIGETYVLLNEYDKAEETFLKAYNITEEIEDAWTKTYALRGLATLYSLRGEYDKALQNAKKSVQISIDLGAVAEESQSYLIMSDVYKMSGDYNKALVYFEKYHEIEDTIFNIENASVINELETKYQTNKISSENEILKQEGELAGLKAYEQEQRNRYLNIGLGLVAVITLVVLWSLFAKQKANKKLKAQKDLIQDRNRRLNTAFSEIEEKNKEITASISYAKRIQSAILPDDKTVKNYLQESFILYKPKDIVAGDFYWMDEVKGTILFAAADCTGHGVPGAMVSVVCNNALNRAVREFGLMNPAEILDKVTDLVIEQFEKSDEDVKDGMDIALCSLKGDKLKYSGANNPLWIIRNGVILETKAVKQPVGKFENREPFLHHEITLEKEDAIYIFSDGYIDQFGGSKGKKLKAKAFKELLLSIQAKTMEEQKYLVNDAFESWRGDLEQIDDVCVIGVRI